VDSAAIWVEVNPATCADPSAFRSSEPRPASAEVVSAASWVEVMSSI